MTDQSNEKVPDKEMTQLEAMEYIKESLNTALSYIGSSTARYRIYLSERRFAKNEIELLVDGYDKILTVWSGMNRRMEREKKNVRSKE